MQLSAVVLLVTVCAVNASVININFYGDNHEVSSVDDCNPQACDQLCRNLGFPGGACVGDRCDCDNFRPSTIEDCNYQACDQLCRRLGFPGGACVGDKCKCDNFKPLSSEYHSKSPGNGYKFSMEGCNSQACDDVCRRLGYRGGDCIGDTCKCYTSKHLSNIFKISQSLKDCAKECTEVCHMMGYPGGDCDKGHCTCHRQGRRQNSKFQKVSSCDIIGCDDMCHRLNYAGGTCEDGSCECY